MEEENENLSSIDSNLINLILAADEQAETLDSVEMLIKAGGANPNVLYNNATPLRIAVAKNNLPLIKKLVEVGADPSDWFALKYASDLKNTDALNYLLDRASFSTITANVSQPPGNTLLHYAVMTNSFPIVRALVDNGADPQNKNKDGQTPLEYAQSQNVNVDNAIVDYLNNITLDFRQDHLMSCMTTYLKDQSRDESFIQEMQKSEGYCNGLSMVFLLSKFISDQKPNNPEADRDDYEWFCKTREDILNIDDIIASENTEQKEKTFQNIDRFISLMKMYQDPNEIFAATQKDPHLFTEISLSDEKKPSTIDREFVLAGKYTESECNQFLEDVIPSGKMCLIGGYDHAIAVYHNEDGYYCYDSRRPEETYQLLNTKEQVTSFIFKQFGYKSNDFCPLGFATFGAEPSATYPSYPDIFGNLVEDEARFKPVSKDIDRGFLEHAVLYNSVELVEAVIAQYGDKLNYEDAYGRALQRNLHQTIDTLIQHNKYPNGVSPVGIAITNDFQDALEHLLKSGYELDIVDSDGKNYLHHAISKQKYACAKVLIDNGIEINAQDNDGCSALIQAAKDNDLKGVQFLIENGADINLCDSDECSALDHFIINQNPEGVELLLSHDATITEQSTELASDFTNNNIIKMLDDKQSITDNKQPTGSKLHSWMKNGDAVTAADQRNNNNANNNNENTADNESTVTDSNRGSGHSI